MDLKRRPDFKSFADLVNRLRQFYVVRLEYYGVDLNSTTRDDNEVVGR